MPDTMQTTRPGTASTDTKATVTMSALTQLMPAVQQADFSAAFAPSNAESTVMLQTKGLMPATTTTAMTAAPSSAPSPMEKVNQPPEINLSPHALPTDAPLDDRLILVEDPDSERAASFRILRHHLMDHGRPQVIVISSANEGEGKTTCALNLALAMAECGRARVLLLEGTLRRPQLADIFQFVPPWCFAEQMAAHREQPLMPWSAVDIPDLWLHVAAIDPDGQRNQLLDAPSFAIALERMRLAGYDHIIIDAPSVLGSAEVNLIQDAADGVVLVARSKRTTLRVMRKAIEQLSPTKIIGTVLLK